MTHPARPPRADRPSWLARQPLARRAALVVGGGMAVFAVLARVIRAYRDHVPVDGASLLRAASVEFLVGALGGALYGLAWQRLRLSGGRRRALAGAIAGAGAMLPLAGWLVVVGPGRTGDTLPVVLAPLAPLAGAVCGALLALVVGEHGA